MRVLSVDPRLKGLELSTMADCVKSLLGKDMIDKIEMKRKDE